MIVVMRAGAPGQQLEAVLTRIQQDGQPVHVFQGEERVVVAVLGASPSVRLFEELEVLPGVEAVSWTSRPYKLASREVHPASTLVRLGGAAIGGSQFVVGIGAARLAEPQQLVELASAQLASQPVSGLAVGDGVVGLVDRGGQLVTYSIPDLQPGATVDLGTSAIVAGPTRVGDFWVLATDRGELVGLDRTLAQAWKVPQSHGAPAGDLGTLGADAVVATRNGWLCKVDGTSGREVAAVDLGQPLSGPPLVIGNDAFVATADGAILKVALPAQSEGTP